MHVTESERPEYEVMYLVVKQVPESVQEAGEELSVTEQHADKPGGPQALSETNTDLRAENFISFIGGDLCKSRETISIVTVTHLFGGLAREASNTHWQKFLKISLAA